VEWVKEGAPWGGHAGPRAMACAMERERIKVRRLREVDGGEEGQRLARLLERLIQSCGPKRNKPGQQRPACEDVGMRRLRTYS
jgi:hypothetical protein